MGTVFLIGDSTCACKRPEERPETGWGEYLGGFLAASWQVDNRAVNGMSSRRFLLSGCFASLVDQVATGDWVVIQFGHNESKSEPDRHTDPWGSFQDNLRFMIAAVRQRGGLPLLLSPIARRKFQMDMAGTMALQPTHGDYPEAMAAVAVETGTVFADITDATMVWLAHQGDAASRQWFMHLPPGMYANFPQGRQDDTHLRSEGAQMIASIVASHAWEAIDRSGLPNPFSISQKSG